MSWPGTDLTQLTAGRRIKVRLDVELYCDDKLCATFTGVYTQTT
ncbi:YiiD C-terminal domain-containing protein [Shewanella hanedai]|nr:YiiD C-terminal domain-containing protein [Shewanella hanedai]